MTAKEVVIALSKQLGLTQEGLACKLGYKNQSSISNLLSRNDGMSIKLETFIRWLDALDAEIVVESINTDGEFVLDGEDEGVTYKDDD